MSEDSPKIIRCKCGQGRLSVGDCPGFIPLNSIPSSIIGGMPNRSSYVEPRWPVILALAAVVALHFSLPQILSLGPNWLLVAVFAVLATLVSISHSRGAERVTYVGGFILIASVTAGRDHIPCPADTFSAEPQGVACSSAAVGSLPLDQQRAGVCRLVLEVRRRRSRPAGKDQES